MVTDANYTYHGGDKHIQISDHYTVHLKLLCQVYLNLKNHPTNTEHWLRSGNILGMRNTATNRKNVIPVFTAFIQIMIFSQNCQIFIWNNSVNILWILTWNSIKNFKLLMKFFKQSSLLKHSYNKFRIKLHEIAWLISPGKTVFSYILLYPGSCNFLKSNCNHFCHDCH